MKDNWIQCGTKLPEPGQRVLVWGIPCEFDDWACWEGFILNGRFYPAFEPEEPMHSVSYWQEMPHGPSLD